MICFHFKSDSLFEQIVTIKQKRKATENSLEQIISISNIEIWLIENCQIIDHLEVDLNYFEVTIGDGEHCTFAGSFYFRIDDIHHSNREFLWRRLKSSIIWLCNIMWLYFMFVIYFNNWNVTINYILHDLLLVCGFKPFTFTPCIIVITGHTHRLDDLIVISHGHKILELNVL